jgi:Protein of unknown function (DUF2849)
MQLVTGNRLRDGVVVYFAGDGRWSPEIDAARLVANDEGASLLAAAQAGPVPLPAIGPALIEAVKEAGRIRPISLRERIRATGPTTGPMVHRCATETGVEG